MAFEGFRALFHLPAPTRAPGTGDAVRNEDRLTFGIPLIPRSSAAHWPTVQHYANATIASIYNQSNPNFHILLACTDVPRLRIPTDERLEVVRCDFWPSKRDYLHGVQDKNRRVVSIVNRHGARGGGYLMLLDSDDLVSRNLTDFVLKDRHPNGYILASGYVLRADTGEIAEVPFADWKRSEFDKLCGSCAIFHLTPDECRTKEFVVSGHHAWDERFAERGRPLAPLPFRGGVYLRQTGANISRIRLAAEMAGDPGPLVRKVSAVAIRRTPDLEREFMLAAVKYPDGWQRLAVHVRNWFAAAA